MKNITKLICFIFLSSILLSQNLLAGEKKELLTSDWSFKGYFGKFDRAALQRGYQVYTEVCASCHSMKYLSYRNLAEKGGPEFSEEQAKAIAANFEVTDGPNDDGDMFERPAKLSDKFVEPYRNVKEATASNGGAYPPDMSVLVILPWLDTSKVRSTIFRPLYKQFYWILVADVLILGYMGAMPAEGLYLLVARVATTYYFVHFLIILPILGYKEKTIPLPLSIMEPVLGGSPNLENIKKKESLN